MNLKASKRPRFYIPLADRDAMAAAEKFNAETTGEKKVLPTVTQFTYLRPSKEFNEAAMAKMMPYAGTVLAMRSGKTTGGAIDSAQVLPPSAMAAILGDGEKYVRECLTGWNNLTVDGIPVEPTFDTDGKLDKASMDVIESLHSELASAIKSDEEVTLEDLKK